MGDGFLAAGTPLTDQACHMRRSDHRIDSRTGRLSEKSRVMRAIGVISGTSMDGIDVSLVETDGRAHVTTGPGRTYSYDAVLRQTLLDLIASPERAEHDALVETEHAVTQAHAAAVKQFMQDFAINDATVDLIGLHGQTVFHRPERRFTRQLGFGRDVARLTGIDTVYRFRHADVAAGGQGAPLAPLYHRALAAALAGPLMVLNLGGVANVTFINGETILAFDCGPASAPLDDFVLRRTGQLFDSDGRLSGSGTVNHDMVRTFMGHPFFEQKPPKSLDRQDFHRRARVVESLSDADGAATLAAFTIEGILASLRHVPLTPVRWLVCGGGRLNQHFMQVLNERLGVPVVPVESVGWDGDFLEAQCFGYLAVRSVLGLPLSLPGTTGVAVPLTGGELAKAS
jgi:anhydro-N-acetylmuramic acid kinase